MLARVLIFILLIFPVLSYNSFNFVSDEERKLLDYPVYLVSIYLFIVNWKNSKLSILCRYNFGSKDIKIVSLQEYYKPVHVEVPQHFRGTLAGLPPKYGFLDTAKQPAITKWNVREIQNWKLALKKRFLFISHVHPVKPIWWVCKGDSLSFIER